MTSKEWKECTLEQISTILGDGLHGTPKYSINGKYAFINGNNLSNGKIIIKSDTKRVDKCEYEKYKKDLNNRTLLVSINGTLGNIAEYNEEKIILGKSACYFNVKEDIDKYFIKYTLLSKIFQDYLNNQATGTTIKNISLKQMREYNFLLPPLETQQKIAKVLSAIDDKIELNNSINNNLEQQAQAIFKSWFVDFEPFGGTMPKEWIIADIYSITNIIYGAPFASKKFNTSNIGKPIVRIRDLKSEQLSTYTDEIHPKGYLLQFADIVVGMDGEFRPYLWGNDEAWLNQRICVFANKNKLDKAFLYFTVKPLLNLVEQTEVATTVIHIGKNDFDKFEINLPTRDVLDKFGMITTPIIEKIVQNKLENKRLSNLRDTLLPKLMSGEIDVSEVDISTDKLYEPANESKLSAEPYNSSGSFASASKNLPSEQSSSADKLLFNKEE